MWTSNDLRIATVNAQGLVTAVKNGTTVVTAKSGSASATATIKVSQSPVSIVVEQEMVTLMSIGETVQLKATVLDQNQKPLTDAKVSWTSSDETVATVSAQGLVTAIQKGSAVITARVEGVSATAQIKVMIPSPDRDALISLYNTTGGKDWDNGENWLSSKPIGDWYGVTADSEDRVIELNLQNNSLNGTLSLELAELDQLRVLVLTGNTDLKGPLPRTLVRLELDVLHVDVTNLCVPSDFEFQAWIYGLTDTRFDTCIGNSVELEALTELYVHTGGSNWNVNTNWLTNTPVGTWYGVDIDVGGNVVELDLARNNLNGTIPPELGNMKELSVLRLNKNQLSGPIPPEIEKLERLWNLNLGNNQLSGHISTEIRELRNLKWLSLHGNQLSGPIPTELGQLKKLGLLSLGSNQLTGAIPPELGLLDRLGSLDLGNNQLSGTIPSELWLLQNLSSLFLSSNQFSGPISPELGAMRNLRILHLGENRFTGSIPDELGQLEKLESLILRNNGDLSGQLPRTFMELRPQTLQLQGTQICIPLDDEFQAWLDRIENSQITLCNDEITALSKFYNETEGENWFNRENWLSDLPPGDWYGVTTNNNGQVVSLNLENNNLNGSLPDILAVLSNIRAINLSRNDELSGQLPRSFLGFELDVLNLSGTKLCVPLVAEFEAWLSRIPDAKVFNCEGFSPDREALIALYNATDGPNWPQYRFHNWLSTKPINTWGGVVTDANGRVTKLAMYRSNLTGIIPPEISQLHNLEVLDLSQNNLTGSIPADLGKLSKLRRLDLNQNNMSGIIPAELGQLRNLEELDLSQNKLSGSIPSELGRFEKLQQLLLDWNNLTGSMPPELGQLSNLQILDITANNLSGSIPAEFGQLSNLRQIRLLNNKLTGRIPPELGQLARLEQLSLGDDLTGSIPPELGELVNLQQLSLNGDLTGSIPPELGRLGRLKWLGLGGNNLEGSIPPELGQLQSLQSLSLQVNELTGNLPVELGQLDNLEVLYLGDNHLSGSIPAEFGQLRSIHQLYLDENELSGSIPPELGHLGNLEQLGLSQNNLTGNIPPALGQLGDLEILYLNQNELTGSIPSDLGRLLNLRSLTIASNQLSGPVPAEFGNLYALKVLTLNANASLSGPLPLTLTNLNLETLDIAGTNLCAPEDTRFRSWIESLVFSRIPDCIGFEGTLVYITQAVQSPAFPVPLIAGEDALMRVFVTSDAGEEIDHPPVRAVFYQNDAPVHTVVIPGQAMPVPKEIEQGSLSASVNANVPGSIIEPGLEIVVEIEPESSVDDPSLFRERIPIDGRMPLDVVDVPTLELTVVPLLWEEAPEWSVLSEIESLSEEDDLFWQTRDLLPVDDLKINIREPVFTSVEPVWQNHGVVLRETEAVYVMDGGSGRYMGVLKTGGGATTVGGDALVSVLEGFTIAHELGHTMGLLHAPCGDPVGTDISFPYEGGTIGNWGYDFHTDDLVSPDIYDLMSYCQPRWISDYHFIRALKHRQLNEADPIFASRVPSNRSILFWGGINEYNELVLEPAFVVDAPPSLPLKDGPYRLSGEGEEGNSLFSFGFDMNEITDGEGSTFAFTIPVQSDWRAKLARISLEGPEGIVSLGNESDSTVALLLDRLTGKARGFLRNWIGETGNSVVARRLLPDNDLKIITSNGIPNASDW